MQLDSHSLIMVVVSNNKYIYKHKININIHWTNNSITCNTEKIILSVKQSIRVDAGSATKSYILKYGGFQTIKHQSMKG